MAEQILTPGNLKFNSHIHGYPHLLKTLLGNIEFALIKPKNNLFVLNFHGTPLKFIPDFELILNFLQKHFEIISPDTFLKLLHNPENTSNNQLLLTFDDGLKNNLNAVKILNERNLSAYFFIIPSFVESKNQKEFYLKNIRPNINTLIDEKEEDFVSLSWEDLEFISKRHRIGSHTLNHTMHAGITDKNLLLTEIVDSKKALEEKLKIKIDSFCSINNTLMSVNSISKEIIHDNYQYHFTTIAGCNKTNSDAYFIKRINMECYWTLGAVKFSIGKMNISRQKAKIREYELL